MRTKFAPISFCVAVLAFGTTTTSSARADVLAQSGPELYASHCASCHGRTGEGDGPVAKSLKVEVPDLTLIARRHGGKFPSDQVERIIDGRFMLLSHGTRTMPIWGEGLMRSEFGNPDANRLVDAAIARLVAYIASLQRPVPRTAE